MRRGREIICKWVVWGGLASQKAEGWGIHGCGERKDFRNSRGGFPAWLGFDLSHISNSGRCAHPTNEDLFVGTPDVGHATPGGKLNGGGRGGRSHVSKSRHGATVHLWLATHGPPANSSLNAEMLLKFAEYFPDTNEHRRCGIGHDDGFTTLIDSYLKHEFGFHLHFMTTPEVSDFAGSNFALVFEGSRSVEDKFIQRHIGRRNDFYPPARWETANEMQGSMTVDNRPRADYSEGFSNFPVTQIVTQHHSVIRLYCFDKGLEFIREWRDTPGRILKVPRRGADGKHQCIFIGWRVLSTRRDRGVVDTGIESGTKMVEHLSVQQGELKEPIHLDWRDKDFPCPIVLKIYSGGVGASSISTLPKFCQRLCVQAGPVGSKPTRLEWGEHS